MAQMHSSAGNADLPETGVGTTQHHRAYDEIKRRIMTGELPPATRMLEVEIAELLGMSRTPVREAMIRLADEGLIAVRPRHGMTVLGVTIDDLEEIYAVRAPLEATAVRLATERGLSARERAAMDAVLERMDRALADGNARTWAVADREFHRLLVLASGNRRLISVAETLQVQLYRGTMATCDLRDKPFRSNTEHREVVEAIIAGKGETAERLHADHLRRTGSMLIDLLRKNGLTEI